MEHPPTPETHKYESFFDTEQYKGRLKERAIRGGMITTASQGILFFLRFASIVILARLLIPEYFGLIAMVASITVIIERFEDLGLGDALVQRKKLTHEQVSTLFWINFGIGILCTLVVSLFAKAIAWFYADDRLIWITVALAFNFILTGSCIQHLALIRRRMRFDHFVLIKISSTLLSIGVAVLLAWKGYGYWALVWKELSRSLIVTFLCWSLCPWRPSLPVRNSGVRPLLAYGGNVTAYNLVQLISTSLDHILLGKFIGPVSVGLYSRAQQLTTVPVTQFLLPIKYVSLPVFSTLQNDPAKFRSYFSKMLEIFSFFYMPLVVYAGIYSHSIVYLTLGSQWMDAVPIFRLLAVSTFVTPVFALFVMLMLSLGQTRRYLLWGLFRSIVHVLAVVVGIQWGAVGIAAALVVAAAVNLLCSPFFVFKDSLVDIRTTLQSVYRPIIASLVMGILLVLTYSHLSPLHVVLKITTSFLLGMSVYLITLVLFPGGRTRIIEYASYPLSALKTRRAESNREP